MRLAQEIDEYIQLKYDAWHEVVVSTAAENLRKSVLAPEHVPTEKPKPPPRTTQSTFPRTWSRSSARASTSIDSGSRCPTWSSTSPSRKRNTTKACSAATKCCCVTSAFWPRSLPSTRTCCRSSSRICPKSWTRVSTPSTGILYIYLHTSTIATRLLMLSRARLSRSRAARTRLRKSFSRLPPRCWSARTTLNPPPTRSPSCSRSSSRGGVNVWKRWWTSTTISAHCC